MNEKYSYKDFTQKSLAHLDASEFNNSEIIGSCFYHETPTEVFPPDILGVTFTKCNMDNVILPEGNTIVGGCHRMLKLQNDLEDWIIDKDGNPVEPTNKERFIRLGLSIDPKDIPAEKAAENICTQKIAQEHQTINAQISLLEAQKKGWR